MIVSFKMAQAGFYAVVVTIQLNNSIIESIQTKKIEILCLPHIVL